jgi:thermostable 8-oxoguanine DNA glycosylase
MKYLIDQHNITNFNRSDDELELFWLFSIVVAGKNSGVQAKKLAEFLKPAASVGISPFRYIDLRSYQYLDDDIKAVKLGQYNRISLAFRESLKLNLRECTVKDLESIHGVGPKTARFFLLHSRPNQRLAVLDTHILSWMRNDLGVDAPKATPNGKRYTELEQIYLDYCDANNSDPAALDLTIWNSRTKKTNRVE